VIDEDWAYAVVEKTPTQATTTNPLANLSIALSPSLMLSAFSGRSRPVTRDDLSLDHVRATRLSIAVGTPVVWALV
jgi:hypothetical protein